MPSLFSEKSRENGLIAAGGNGIIRSVFREWFDFPSL